MAAAAATTDNPVQALQDEITCTICLEFFTDPMMIIGCGHNFCQACITRYWQSSFRNVCCPQCRATFSHAELKPNRQLRNVAEVTRLLSLQSMKTPESGKDVCSLHQEPLKLFCQKDHIPICVVCDRAKEHRDHPVVPIEEAAQELKDQIQRHLEMLRKRRGVMEEAKKNDEKASRELLEKAGAESQVFVPEIEQFCQVLKDEVQFLLPHLEQVDILKRQDEDDSKHTREIAQLSDLISDLERKCDEPGIEFLKETESILNSFLRCTTQYTAPPEEKKAEIEREEELEAEWKEPMEGATGYEGPAKATRSHDKKTEEPVMQAPLRQVAGPHGVMRLYVPFTTTDLFNWKQEVGVFKEDPVKGLELLRIIIAMHNPTWKDLQSLLTVFCTFSERVQVEKRVRDKMAEHETVGLGGQNPPRWTRTASKRGGDILQHEPDPNVTENMPYYALLHNAFLKAMEELHPKQVNLSKLYEIRQNPKESPSDFWERLTIAARKYTNLNPEVPENEVLFKNLFIEQAAPDIRKKLQKIEGAPRQSVITLMDVAYRVFENRGEKEKKERKKEAQVQASMIALAVRGGYMPRRGRGRGRGHRPAWDKDQRHPEMGRRHPLDPDVCANCGERGHWRRECMQNRNRGQQGGGNCSTDGRP